MKGLGGPHLVTIAALLTGCTAGVAVNGSITTPNKLETFVQGDLSSAQAIAQAAGDSDGASCWQYLAGISEKWPATTGAATAVELARIPHTANFVAACQSTLLSGAIPNLVTGFP